MNIQQGDLKEESLVAGPSGFPARKVTSGVDVLGRQWKEGRKEGGIEAVANGQGWAGEMRVGGNEC